jgi:NAD(P)H-dependent flavin oxidoreductase YrpB (nitropropane dioxygenase family)
VSDASAAGAVDPRLSTRATDLFGCRYPIVQTGMGWVANSKLVAATCNAGGLGIIAAAPMTYDQMVQSVREVQAATDKPFGLNMRTDASDIDKRVDFVIKERIRVASFAQAPGEKTVKKLKDAGIVVMPTIGAKRHAEKVAAWGVDALIAQGAEGGGHTGSVPTSILIPQVLDTVDIPVLAAGGFTDGRGLAAALAWGASGIAMGTRFLLSSDSSVPDHIKALYLQATVFDTVVTKAIDGAPQRVIRTAVIDRLEKAKVLGFPKAAVNALRFRKLTGMSMPTLLKEGLAMKKSQDLSWAQMAMAANAPMMTKAAIVDGHPEVGILPTGQGVGAIDDLPSCQEIIDRVVAGAIEALDRVCGA